MEVQLIETVGRIAGIGGIALGVFLLIALAVLRTQITGQELEDRTYRLLRLLLLLAGVSTLAGIGAWLYSLPKVAITDTKDDSEAVSYAHSVRVFPRHLESGNGVPFVPYKDETEEVEIVNAVIAGIPKSGIVLARGTVLGVGDTVHLNSGEPWIFLPKRDGYGALGKLRLVISDPSKSTTGEIHFQQNFHRCDLLVADKTWRSVPVPPKPNVHLVETDRAIPACRSAVKKYPSENRFVYFLARALVLSGEYEEGQLLLERLVEQGIPEAMYALGRMHMNAKSVPADEAPLYDLARALFERAIKRGYAPGYVGLGDLFREGLGVSIDLDKARENYDSAAALGWDDAVVMTALVIVDQQSGFPTAGGIDEALALLDMATNRGSGFALNYLGYLHLNGRGVPHDFRKAREYFEKAVDKGFPYALVNLGVVNAYGYGVKQNVDVAKEYFQKAVDHGFSHGHMHLATVSAEGLGDSHVDFDVVANHVKAGLSRRSRWAMNYQGWLYEKGYGVPKDLQQAVTWYKRAAARGNRAAIQNLGRLYERGSGLRLDLEEARVFYKRLISLGNDDGHVRLSTMYFEGPDRESNDERRDIEIRRLESAATRGSRWAMHYLGWIHERGLGGAPANYVMAREWYERAMLAGNHFSICNMGYLEQRGKGGIEDPEQGFRLTRKAARLGALGCQNALGWYYEQGFGGRRDEKRALVWYRKAAKRGNTLAMRNLARLYRTGRGVDRDIDAARRWLEAAVALDDWKASDDLARLPKMRARKQESTAPISLDHAGNLLRTWINEYRLREKPSKKGSWLLPFSSMELGTIGDMREEDRVANFTLTDLEFLGLRFSKVPGTLSTSRVEPHILAEISIPKTFVVLSERASPCKGTVADGQAKITWDRKSDLINEVEISAREIEVACGPHALLSLESVHLELGVSQDDKTALMDMEVSISVGSVDVRSQVNRREHVEGGASRGRAKVVIRGIDMNRLRKKIIDRISEIAGSIDEYIPVFIAPVSIVDSLGEKGIFDDVVVNLSLEGIFLDDNFAGFDRTSGGSARFRVEASENRPRLYRVFLENIGYNTGPYSVPTVFDVEVVTKATRDRWHSEKFFVNESVIRDSSGELSIGGIVSLRGERVSELAVGFEGNDPVGAIGDAYSFMWRQRERIDVIEGFLAPHAEWVEGRAGYLYQRYKVKCELREEGGRLDCSVNDMRQAELDATVERMCRSLGEGYDGPPDFCGGVE